MKEQLISFKTAKLAEKKELHPMLDIGLNCYVYNRHTPNEPATMYHVHIEYPDKHEYLYAPTQSLLQKWLREKHNIHIITKPWTGDIKEKITYACDICIFGTKTYIKLPRVKSYEEALEEGLQTALELI